MINPGDKIYSTLQSRPRARRVQNAGFFSFVHFKVTKKMKTASRE